MTPAARLSAAIALLDQIFAHDPAERSLTRWARANRYAGSKDRAAVRDLVFDCLRRKRSLAHVGGAETGRAVVLAQQFLAGAALDELFSGARFAPEPVTKAEAAQLAAPGDAPDPVRLDYPDFLDADLRRALGGDLSVTMQAMQRRAPVDLRVNTLKTTTAEAQAYLARDLIFTDPIPDLPGGLRITENPRKLNASLAYRYGFVELQDESSQKIARFAKIKPGMSVLDYCAGGGGKTLALAALMHGQGRLAAHDANPGRMKDLPERARRAGADIEVLPPARLPDAGRFDLVFVDAPCSGSGAWRRNPDSKWRLTPESIAQLCALQRDILQKASRFVAPGGRMLYATCSLLDCENGDQTGWFVETNQEWRVDARLSLSPVQNGDGFYGAILSR